MICRIVSAGVTQAFPSGGMVSNVASDKRRMRCPESQLTPHPPLRGPKLAKSVCFSHRRRLTLRRDDTHHPNDLPHRFGGGSIFAKANAPPPYGGSIKSHLSVRAWGGGLILRGSTEEVKTTGRPQVRTTNRIRRTAKFKIGKRMPSSPFFKSFGILKDFFKSP